MNKQNQDKKKEQIMLEEYQFLAAMVLKNKQFHPKNAIENLKEQQDQTDKELMFAGDSGANAERSKGMSMWIYEGNSISKQLNSIFGNHIDEHKLGEWNKLFNVSQD